MIFEFDGYSLDTEGYVLNKGTEPVSFEPLAFQLLQLLIENHDRVVSKDEIIERVWEGRIVSDAALTTGINAARRAVGDNGKDQKIIRTYPRRGFQFVAKLEDQSAASAETEIVSPPRLPDKPSIAVLPFDNLSGDPEQEYFSDGITEDIITALSRIRQFFVIARNTTFTDEIQAMDAQTVANDLGVRYVLKGSVRKAGGRVRITAQLIDGETGNHIWAERYDRVLEDIFDVQDEITLTVVGSVLPELDRAERERAMLKKPENLTAWDLTRQGISRFYDSEKSGTRENLELAKTSFEQALKSDPNFAPAYAGLARAYGSSVHTGNSESPEEDLEKGLEYVRRAAELDSDISAFFPIGINLIMSSPVEAKFQLERMIELNPSSAIAYAQLGYARTWSGDAESAILCFETAMRLSPRDPEYGRWMSFMAQINMQIGNYEEGLLWSNRAHAVPGMNFWSYAMKVCILGHLGRIEEARETFKEVLKRKPDFNCAFVREHYPIKHEGYLANYLTGLSKAGVPES